MALTTTSRTGPLDGPETHAVASCDRCGVRVAVFCGPGVLPRFACRRVLAEVHGWAHPTTGHRIEDRCPTCVARGNVDELREAAATARPQLPTTAKGIESLINDLL